MILEFWDKISYMVQLLFACGIFFIPARKRSRFGIRTGVLGAVLVLAAYMINCLYQDIPEGIFLFVYWMWYIFACILYVWVCLDTTIWQAVYCAVFACGMQHIAYDLYLLHRLLGGKSNLADVLLYAAVYALFYRFFAKKLTDKGKFSINRQSFVPIVTIILLVWILSVLETSSYIGKQAGVYNHVIYRIIDGVCCFYALWVQINQKEKLSLQRELDGINSAWQQQKKQYEVTSETIANINRKCHDLKHQIRAVKEMKDEKDKTAFLSELEQDIMIYDAALKTGNKALDIVLMEKGLLCKNYGIQWSCMADGTKLEFMKLEDIYAIFGNALDNAIAAVMNLEEEEKKIISVKMIAQNNILVIQIQNYFKADLHFENGLPVTTKRNKRDHGYGMKSVRYTAEKYNGTITVQAEQGIFTLQILIPVK